MAKASIFRVHPVTAQKYHLRSPSQAETATSANINRVICFAKIMNRPRLVLERFVMV